MGFKRGEWIWELMLVRHPVGTHLSNSSVPGGTSPLVRDCENALVTQAVLFAVRKPAVIISAGAALVFTAGVGVGASKPRVQRGLMGLKSTLGRRAQESAEIDDAAPAANVPELEPEAAVAAGLRAV